MVDFYNSLDHFGSERNTANRPDQPTIACHPVNITGRCTRTRGSAGQRIWHLRIHRPSVGVFDSESSEEDPKLQAGRLQIATHRLSYDNLSQTDEPAPEETQEVTLTLPPTQSVLGVTIHYNGHPTTTRWYTDDSKRHGRAGAGISNGNFRAAFRVHGPQQVYKAETMACALASHLAQPGDEIILDNQGVVKATPTPRKGVFKHQDCCDPSDHRVTTKKLTVRWTPRHRDLRNATTYQDYVDIKGNDDSGTLANTGDNLPMDLPVPKPHDILLHGQIMLMPAESWIMQLRQRKQMADVHWIS